MRVKPFVLALLPCLALPAILAFQTPDKLDRKQLRDVLVQLGYEVKDLDSTAGKEKYSYVVERGGLNIPIAAEISPNDSYIWLTVFCKQGIPASDRAAGLLRRNAEIQPSQFYITKSDKVMMALPIENHGVTNAMIRQRSEKIADDVVKTKEDWG